MYYLISPTGQPAIAVQSTTQPQTTGHISGPFATIEELETTCALYHCPCTECYGLISLRYSEPTRKQLIARCVCFSCNFWLDIIDQKCLIIEGDAYTIQPDAPSSAFRGYGGRQFKIRLPDKSITITRNLWHRGTVPNHFRKRLPDNAQFIP